MSYALPSELTNQVFIYKQRIDMSYAQPSDLNDQVVIYRQKINMYYVPQNIRCFTLKRNWLIWILKQNVYLLSYYSLNLSYIPLMLTSNFFHGFLCRIIQAMQIFFMVFFAGLSKTRILLLHSIEGIPK